MNEQSIGKAERFYDGLSVTSHYIRMYFGETPLAHGTCFFVMSGDGPVLVTNRHNFTGRNNITGKTLHKKGGIPDNAVVIFQTSGGEVCYQIDLLDHSNPDTPSWTEHPILGATADVIALPTGELSNIVNETNSITLEDDWHRWDVGSELHVIGFPYGQVGGPFPIWSKGFIASEPDVDIAELPMFLIDCRSRPGQSGSPVYARFRSGEVVEHKGQKYAAKHALNYFVGVYSGRLRNDSDLGIVWKRNCIEDLVNHAIAHGTQHQTDRRRHRFSVTVRLQQGLDQLVSDNDEVQ